MGSVAAVLFDLDDTLLDGDAAWAGGMDALLVRCGEVDRAAFSDVVPVLGRLRHLRLGVVTNGDGRQQRQKLEALGLTQWFAVVAVSGDLGVAKPARRIFAHAAATLGIRPDECLVVGDNFERDIRGALAAGMKAVWLNRRTADRHSDVPTIHSLAELPALLGVDKRPSAVDGRNRIERAALS